MTAVTVLAAALSQHAHAYVLADPAQDKSLPNALLFESANAVCLLDGGADVRAVAPHLIRIDAANYLHAGAWLDQHAANVPCATLLISTMPLAAMAAHLSAFVDVVLGFVTPGWFVTRVLDAAAVQTGVAKILTDNYGVDGVADVHCPSGVRVTPGTTFTCDAAIDGDPVKVPIRITDGKGGYEVGRPT